MSTSTAVVFAFPSREVLRAIRVLEGRSRGLEAELAASVLVKAMAAGDCVPPWTLTLLLSTMLQSEALFALRLADSLSVFDDVLDILVVGQQLVMSSKPHDRLLGLRLLRRLG